MRTGRASKGKSSITSLRSDTSLRQTHVDTSAPERLRLAPRFQFAYPTASFFWIPRVMVTEVMNDHKHDDCSQVIVVPPFVYIRLAARRERIGVANVRMTVFLTTKDSQG